jgi:glyoxylase-like metal-dependent hydrolase (beta-lactamase superfamily II)
MIQIKTFFDSVSSTFTHVVHDPKTNQCAVIDSVLGYDQYSGLTNTQAADEVMNYIIESGLNIEWLLETHIHADHISGAKYIQSKMGGKIGLGERIKDVLELWVPLFNTGHDTPVDASQFDVLFKDGQSFQIGTVDVKVMFTPGHTPACACYLVEDAVFVGDTIFMPDIGTARTDFPGGCSASMYDSVRKILSLPEDTRIFLCHDYPPPGREKPVSHVTVREQRQANVMVRDGIGRNEYINMRTIRDMGKAVPKMLLPSIQVNLRAGTFGAAQNNQIKYIKIPVDCLDKVAKEKKSGC